MNEKIATPTLADIIGSYGAIEAVQRSRIQKLVSSTMVKNWTTIPHVTHQDEIDLTDLELKRKAGNEGRQADGRLSPLPFLFKAVAAVLHDLPNFNSVFDPESGDLILRRYVNIGMAVDTPGGLLVAVVKGCDTKSVEEIGAESYRLAEKARSGRLPIGDMSGSGFTISSLGPLGGTSFTPIINAPEVAILGVSRLTDRPVRTPDDGVAWRAKLPVALSYDHRVINGADAGRFMAALQIEIDRLAN